MSDNIRTRWHRVIEAVKADRIVLSTDLEQAEHPRILSEEVFSPEGLRDGLNLFDRAPKYFFGKDVMDAVLANSREVVKSIHAMHKAGVCRLPFPMIVAEYDWAGPTIAILSESKDEECPFRVNAMQLFTHIKAWDGEVVCLSPHTFRVSPVMSMDDGEAGMKWKVFTAGWMRDTQPARDLAAKSIDYWKPSVEPGLIAAMLLLNTRGITREVIVPGEKLNRSRIKRNKPPIPSHTVIRVGHVYDRSGKTVSNELRQRKQQPLHWRSGYTAIRWVGKGRAQEKIVYVEPYLVNYDPVSAETPRVPERRVKW